VGGGGGCVVGGGGGFVRVKWASRGTSCFIKLSRGLPEVFKSGNDGENQARLVGKCIVESTSVP